jgi:septal ring factor EnvC (AmiA/AmiB activator)
MNKDRRKRIDEVAEKLGELKDEVTAIMEEEQETFDNMPESLQGSERGERSQTAIDTLSEAKNDLQNAIDGLMGIE